MMLKDGVQHSISAYGINIDKQGNREAGGNTLLIGSAKTLLCNTSDPVEPTQTMCPSPNQNIPDTGPGSCPQIQKNFCSAPYQNIEDTGPGSCPEDHIFCPAPNQNVEFTGPGSCPDIPVPNFCPDGTPFIDLNSCPDAHFYCLDGGTWPNSDGTCDDGSEVVSFDNSSTGTVGQGNNAPFAHFNTIHLQAVPQLIQKGDQCKLHFDVQIENDVHSTCKISGYGFSSSDGVFNDASSGDATTKAAGGLLSQQNYTLHCIAKNSENVATEDFAQAVCKLVPSGMER